MLYHLIQLGGREEGRREREHKGWGEDDTARGRRRRPLNWGRGVGGERDEGKDQSVRESGREIKGKEARRKNHEAH